MEYGIETILAAIIINAILFAVVFGFMFKYIKQLVDRQSVDNSLQNELSKSKEDNELKDKKIQNLRDQNSILMVENTNIADKAEELAILLDQK